VRVRAERRETDRSMVVGGGGNNKVDGVLPPGPARVGFGGGKPGLVSNRWLVGV
jgi:hypothetical protein